jgi:hypothetical protein
VKIKVSASFSGKISTGDFQNSAPFFSAEVEYETPAEGVALEKEIDLNQKRLHDICYGNFKVVADQAKVEKIRNDKKGFRFYKTDIGDLPSVTTVIDPEYRSWVADEDLKIAIAEGNIHHARVAHYIESGKWVDPKQLSGVSPDILALKGRVLGEWNFPAMTVKYPIIALRNGFPVYNHKHKYAGTFDAECMYPLGGTGDPVPTLIDFKRTADKDKNFTQISAYSNCEGMEHIKQMMIVETNSENNQGFKKPLISTSIEKYFEVFLEKRRMFEEIYGI